MKKKIIICISLLILLITYLYLGNKFHIYLDCPIKKTIGLYCPGCGITRMLLSILQLDFYQAFRYNPIIFIDVPILFILFVLNLLYKDKENLKKINNIIIIVLAIITVAYGILRNIPAFDFLAPTQLR